MYMSNFLVGFAAAAATVHAIDIRLWYRDNNCKGVINVKCINKNPNECCGPSVANIYASIGFGPVPSRWKISMRGHTAQSCGPVKQTVKGYGPNDNFCIDVGAFSGGGYSVISTGRRSDQIVPQGSFKCAKPDALEVNGTDVVISHLNDNEQTELLTFVGDATTADLPTIADRIDRIVKNRK